MHSGEIEGTCVEALYSEYESRKIDNNTGVTVSVDFGYMWELHFKTHS